MRKQKRFDFADTRDLQSLLLKSYRYLLNNFHKFDQTNKVKIALKLVEKHVDIGLATALAKGQGEKHLHLTTIQLTAKDEPELIDTLLGRNGRLTIKAEEQSDRQDTCKAELREKSNS